MAKDKQAYPTELTDFLILLGDQMVNQIPSLINNVSKIGNAPTANKKVSKKDPSKEKKELASFGGGGGGGTWGSPRLHEQIKDAYDKTKKGSLNSTLNYVSKKYPLMTTMFSGLIDGLNAKDKKTQQIEENIKDKKEENIKDKKGSEILNAIQHDMENPLKLPQNTLNALDKRRKKVLDDMKKFDETLRTTPMSDFLFDQKTSQSSNAFGLTLRKLRAQRFQNSPVVDSMHEINSYITTILMVIGRGAFSSSKFVGQQISSNLNKEQKKALKSFLKSAGNVAAVDRAIFGSIKKTKVFQQTYQFLTDLEKGELNPKEYEALFKFIGAAALEEILVDKSQHKKPDLKEPRLPLLNEVFDKYNELKQKYEKKTKEMGDSDFVGNLLETDPKTPMPDALETQIRANKDQNFAKVTDQIQVIPSTLGKFAERFAMKTLQSSISPLKQMFENSQKIATTINTKDIVINKRWKKPNKLNMRPGQLLQTHAGMLKRRIVDKKNNPNKAKW